jgi:hypothetical protein
VGGVGAGVGEPLAAVVAGERLVPGVDPDMLLRAEKHRGYLWTSQNGEEIFPCTVKSSLYDDMDT